MARRLVFFMVVVAFIASFCLPVAGPFFGIHAALIALYGLAQLIAEWEGGDRNPIVILVCFSAFANLWFFVSAVVVATRPRPVGREKAGLGLPLTGTVSAALAWVPAVAQLLAAWPRHWGLEPLSVGYYLWAGAITGLAVLVWIRRIQSPQGNVSSRQAAALGPLPEWLPEDGTQSGEAPGNSTKASAIEAWLQNDGIQSSEEA